MERGRTWLALLCCWPGLAGAGEFPPVTNHAALARSFALPAPGATRVLPEGTSRAQLAFDLINEFEFVGFDTSSNCVKAECQRLDGEVYRLAFGYRAALAPAWEWSLELSALSQNGGFMDHAIEDWHAWLGLPNGGREFRPPRQYEYLYRRGSDVVLDVREPSDGPGDAMLGVGRQLGPDSALRAQVKLPTGDAAGLAGGNAGAALWLDAGFTPAPRWRGYVSAGVSVNERGDVLPEQQNTAVAIGGIGLSVAASSRVALHAQLHLHSRLYDDSTLRGMRRNGAALGLGLRYRAGKSTFYDLTLLEDTNVNVSPDFGLQFAATWSPG